jgi:hypothetical protein
MQANDMQREAAVAVFGTAAAFAFGDARSAVGFAVAESTKGIRWSPSAGSAAPAAPAGYKLHYQRWDDSGNTTACVYRVDGRIRFSSAKPVLVDFVGILA